MKRLFIHNIIIIAAMLTVAGCSAGGYNMDIPEPNINEEPSIAGVTKVSGLVTVKFTEDGLGYLQYGNYMLLPDTIEYTRQLRAMASMTIYPEKVGPGWAYYKTELEWIEALDEGQFGVSASAGDPLDINLSSAYTCVEDGYLTIKYLTWWGETPLHHDFYLSRDPKQPYALTLVQDSHGDGKDNCTEGLVCFDINSLPDTEGQTLTISLQWTKLDGTLGTAYFGFKTRE